MSKSKKNMNKFKKIGVLGGMGPVASACFYQLLLKVAQKKYDAVQDDEYPQIIINSLAIRGSSEQGMEDNILITSQLIEGVKVLENAGAEFIVIPCNSVHNVIEKLRLQTKIPVLNLIEKVSSEVKKNKSKRVLVLSSGTTDKYGLYDRLANKNVKLIKPKNNLRKKVTKLILAVMGGKNIEGAKIPVIKEIDKMFEFGQIDSVILGCTELPLAIKKQDTKVKLYDSLEILTESAINYAKND